MGRPEHSRAPGSGFFISVAQSLIPAESSRQLPRQKQRSEEPRLPTGGSKTKSRWAAGCKSVENKHILTD
jgi:hypothetical protein